MNDLFFSGGASLFTVAATVGTIIFAFRVGLMLIGLDADSEADVDIVDVDADGGDSGEAFKILSLHVISALLMGFGWTGLAALKASGMPWLLAFGVGAVVGLGTGWLSAKMMQLIHRMHVSGTMDIAQALYTEGVVYASIPSQRSGKGEVRVVINERERFFYAVTEGSALETRTPIRVTSIDEDNTVVVEAADSLNALPKE